MLGFSVPKINWWIKSVLAVQIFCALFTVSSTFPKGSGFTYNEQSTPIYDPFKPGDQVRRFEPGKLPYSSPGKPIMPSNEPERILEEPGERLYRERLSFAAINHKLYGPTIQVTGEFETGDAKRFERFLRLSNQTFQTVSFDSPGGVVEEALAISRMIRQRSLNTLISHGALCASACPFSFAGGTERLASREGYIGVHQAFFEEPGIIPVFFAVEDIQMLQGDVLKLLIDMGVDPWIMVPALKTPKDEIYFLVKDELLKNKLATRIVD